MRMRIGSFLVFAFFVTVAGCRIFGPGDGGTDARTARYYPLAIGNSWTYVLSSPRTGEASREYVRAIVRADSGWFEMSETSISVHDSGYSSRLSYTDGGIFHRSGPKFHTGTFLLRAPVEVGNSWCTDKHFCGEIVSTTATVMTPAGTFRNAIVVAFHQYMDSTHAEVSAHSVQYFAAGVGHIRNDLYLSAHGDPPDLRWELTGYVVR